MDLDSPLDSDELVFPCKGCGEILEEGKAFELAGHRWHLECFKCNTCGTILDSDANLLLLGDGSLICNNCTYSCSACGNKIQDLAILTGDQAYCAGCFRCRNCKKKIENLRYARTSQGMFCMDCHDALMARRRKKTKNAAQRLKQQNSNAMLLDKSLPSLPPSAVMENAFSPDSDRHFSGPGTPTELPASESFLQRKPPSRTVTHDASFEIQELDASGPSRDRDDTSWADKYADTLEVPARRSNRDSAMSDGSDAGDGFFIPMALDPSIVPTPPVLSSHDEGAASEKENHPPGGLSSDYFSRKANESRRPTQDLRKDSLQRSDSRSGSHPTSPRASFKESGRKDSETRLDIMGAVQPRRSGERDRSRDPSPLNPRSDSRADSEKERFKLQEAPASKKKGLSAKDTIFGGSPQVTSPNDDDTSYRRPSAAATPQSETPATNMRGSSDAKRTSGRDQIQTLPKRGDSLQAGKANSQQTIARKEVGSRTAPRSDNRSEPSSAKLGPGGKPDLDSPSSTYTPSPGLNGGRVISKPMESPLSKSFMDVPSKSERRVGPISTGTDSFTSPREAPEKPSHQRGKSGSISTIRSGEPTDSSPNASRVQASDVSSTDERAGEGDEGHSFLKRVSNSVRHARSHSDRTIARNSRDKKGLWPQTPNGASATADLLGLSPSIGSPDSTGIDWYRNALRKAQQDVIARDEEIQKLKDAMNGKTTIKQMNTELREKRSTMVVLDTQKEIVVRELEVLTDHIAASKRNGEPLDTTKLTNVVLRDFADSLQRLKDSFAPQIEELLEKKTNIEQETRDLSFKRDRVMTEFETLSIKNAQLTEMNNSIIQNNAAHQNAQQANQGLGIYQAQDSRATSIGGSTMRTDSHVSGATIVNELSHEEPVVMAPKVVDVRKGQVKKFNWKKGGIVAKTVGKGLKDAFSSDRNQQMPMDGLSQNLEGTPYGSVQSGTYPSTTLPKDYRIGDPQPDRAATFGLFNQQKGRAPTPQQGRTTPLQGGVGAPPPQENASVLYGSELQARADYEGVSIPGVIVRCIQEVQSRGMDVEGIYRKSGGSGQIQEVKDGFTRDNNYDISDNDLDIHAVTSALKQYFRKLPNPLITFEVYDKLLATAPGAPVQPTMGGGTKGGENGGGAEKYTKEDRIERTKAAIADLPKAHRATLEFLIWHLDKIVKLEKVNLMTSLNCAVVFAPTIMRPLDIVREMTDTASKTDVVRFLIQNCESIFLTG